MATEKTKSVTLPDDLWKQIRMRAAAHDVTSKAMIEKIVEAGLEALPEDG